MINTRKRHKKNKDRDFVKINVGGSIFTTTKTTLMSNSSYFMSRFSMTWDTTPQVDVDARDDDDEDDLLFVDQNPKSFEVLLAFMREGLINKTDITQSVLVQADFFGMDTLLRAVKCAAFRYMNPKDNGVSDNEACQRFNDTYGGITGAIKSGVLPSQIKKAYQGDEHFVKEYAHLRILDLVIEEHDSDNRDLTTLWTFVQVPAHVLDPTASRDPEANPAIVPNCHTFLDAINWLHRHGFVTNEDKLQKVDMDHRVYADYWFSRCCVKEEKISHSDCIVFDGETAAAPGEASSQERRQFAALICDSNSDTEHLPIYYVLAETGKEIAMEVTAEYGIHGSLADFIGITSSSRISKIPAMHSSTNQVNWLAMQGYTREEASLETIFRRIVCGTLNADANSLFVLLRSRKLESS
jgi:hypothetical protein